MTSRGYFGKMNSTLGSVVPLAMFYLVPSVSLLQPTLQALFVNKIQEYAAKKKAADGGMVDATPETQADLQVLKKNSSFTL